MTKRNLFNELKQGLEEILAHQQGKITLRTETLERKEPMTINASEVKAIRQKLKLSQSVFANRLRTSVRTYQGWEQGRTKPNPQAVLLLRMAEKSPQVFEQLANL